MLLRRGLSELGRRLLHQWTVRYAAVTASNNGRNTETNREEQQQYSPSLPRTYDHTAGYDRQALSTAWSSNSDDLCSTNYLTDWNTSRDSSVLAQLRSLHHFNFGRGRPESELLPLPYQQHQRRGISTSVPCSAEEEEPVRSPLSQAPSPLQGSGGQKMGVSPTRTAIAVLTGIRQSPQKLNLVAEMVRGMRVEDALIQMAVSVKRAAKTVSKVVHSAQANAVHNFGLEKDRLVVSEAFVGKDRYLKRMRPHGKGKAGKLEHARARLTVVVKEMSVEQETDLARLRVFRMRGTRMSRAQARLVPHRVLATQWSRQRVPAAAAVDGAKPEATPQQGGE